MGITYRQGNDGRLSVAQMDDNFHYLEDQLAGLSSSNSDRLINNNLEVVLDNKGTLNTPLLLPTDIWTATCDYSHMTGMYDFDNTGLWEFNFKFEVSQDGIVSTMVDNPFPILTNPGYTSGNSFRFTEADHGIPDFIFDVQLNNVVLSGAAGWTANLAVTEAPEYPSTIKSLGAVKITANDKHLTFGTDGSLTFPDYSVQTTAYAPKYKVFTALLTQSGGDSDLYLTESPLVIGTSYLIGDGDGGDDFTNVGAPNSNNGTRFIATGTTPANWTHNAILYYNTGAPVATVLENTIGNIWFTYDEVGSYVFNSNGLFIENKTVAFVTPNYGNDYNIIGMGIGNINSGDIQTINAGNLKEFANNLLYNTPIEIRVYN